MRSIHVFFNSKDRSELAEFYNKGLINLFLGVIRRHKFFKNFLRYNHKAKNAKIHDKICHVAKKSWTNLYFKFQLRVN